MSDYANPKTPLTASGYAWSATAVRPTGHGSNLSQQIDGSYTPPPGATVGVLLTAIRGVFAKEWGMPATSVTIAKYSLREK
ncbi:hypothetical protein [Streptomyces odontomachi]|uniref:hypothetical protein n=1 Tax=Streptomyces odontomachi TaxID=2944940 RepID=UPI00210A9B89|nr:hypothetical protein [Streptomyces sp. ODS25]